MDNNEVIQHLKAFPAGNIYYIAPKEYFLRGYEYYRQGRLITLDRNKDSNTVIASVLGSHVYVVTFFIKDSQLQMNCVCPVWSPDMHCKHVVCVFLAIKNILDPHLFHIEHQSYRYHNRFYNSLMSLDNSSTASPENPYVSSAGKMGLYDVEEIDVAASIGPIGTAEKKPEYSIVLEQKKDKGPLEVSVQEDGRSLSEYEYYHVPAALHTLLRTNRFYYYVDRNKIFHEYLTQYGNIYPLFLKMGDERISLEWDPALAFSSKTGIDVQKDRVAVMRLCFRDGEFCTRWLPFGNDLIIDLGKQKIGVIKESEGWNLWQFYAGTIMSDRWNRHTLIASQLLNNVLHIPIDQFRDCQVNISDANKVSLEDIILSIHHINLSPVAARHTYSMVIEPDEQKDGFMVLKTCCNLGGLSEATTRTFFECIPYIINGDFYSSMLRAKKRRAVLLKTFMKLLSVRGKQKAGEIIKVSLNTEGDFYKRSVKTEAGRILMDAFSWINSRPVRLQFSDDQWYIVNADKESESLLYTIPYEIFGLGIFDEMKSHNGMNVSAKSLHQHLPALYSGLKAHNIPLFFKGKPVKETRWDFSFDCRRENGIDWFEIKPEIKCDGRLIDNAGLQRAISQNGMVEGDDLIEILDPKSQEVLKTIASMTKEGKCIIGRAKEIVQVPRLKILDWIYLRNKGVEVRLSKEDEALIERLSRFEKIEKRPIPGGLKTELRSYQKDGYYWLAFLYEHRFGACLADDMGLGKTLQAISLMAGIKEGMVKPPCSVKGPHLIVLPTSLIFNWEREIARFYPDLKMYIYTGKERSTEFDNADVVLTTYGLLRRDIEKLKDISFHIVIFDEAQAVKNILADTTSAARQLKGQFKLSMTGTPIENHLGEYYSIMDLSVPGLLDDYDDFKSQIKLEASPFIDTLLRRTMPFVLRRTKDRILKELPAKIETDIYLDLTEKQKVLYAKTVERVKRTIADAYETKTPQQAQIIALTAILKLRQLCVSPKLIDPAFHETSPKIEFLIGKLRELADEGHSALVFSQFTSFLNILEDDLKKEGISFQRLDGSTAAGKRKKLVEDFQEGEKASIFLLSLKAGGQGLNLTKASYVFHLDPWWNPAVENQASDRAHRIGQKNKVMITRILMRHTVEEKMMGLKQKKLALYNAVMEGAMRRKKGATITRSDFNYLLSDVSSGYNG